MDFKASILGEHVHFTCMWCEKPAAVTTLTYDQFNVEQRLSCETCGQEVKIKISNARGFEGPMVSEHPKVG